jgi:hypothetical protein
VNTLITPRKPAGSSPDDDDQTGVRALLSGLPEPDPMPAYLVERIGASLAAEQAQREHASGTSVVPMLAARRRRPGRVLFAAAGAAAAVVLAAVVGNSMQPNNQSITASDTLQSAESPQSREAYGAAPPGADDKASGGGAAPTSSIQVRSSEVRYTESGFVTQARSLGDTAVAAAKPTTAHSLSDARISTAGGLTECLGAIGAGGAQQVVADLATYEGQPAVIIVATTDGIPTAYAVGRDCSRSHAALLRPATPLR